MAQAFFDRVKVGIASGGTGALGLGGAATGYQSFAAAGVTNGTTVSYVIEDGSGWEIGRGTYATSGTMLTRTTMLASSTGSPLNVSTNAVCYIALLAEDLAALGGPPSIAACTDVDLSTAPTDQQALIYSGSEKKWKPGTVAASGGSSGGGSTTAAASVVQSAKLNTNNNTGSISFANAPTVGNLIVLFIVGRGIAAPSGGFTVQQSSTDNSDYYYAVATRVVASGDTASYSIYPGASGGTSNGAYVSGYEVAGAAVSGSTFAASAAVANGGSTDTIATTSGQLVLGSILSSTSITATFSGANADNNDTLSGQVDGEGDRAANIPFSTTATGTSTAISFTPTGSSTLSIATAVLGPAAAATTSTGQTYEQTWTTPQLSSFTQQLSSGATASQMAAGIGIVAPGAGGDAHSVAMIAVPAVGQRGWTADFRIYHNAPAGLNNPFAGVYALAGGKALTCGWDSAGLVTQQWNNIAPGQQSYSGATTLVSGDSRPGSWMRIEWDNVNNYTNIYTSEDGVNWFKLLQSNNFLSGQPDHVAFGVNANYTTGTNISIGCVSYLGASE